MKVVIVLIDGEKATEKGRRLYKIPGRGILLKKFTEKQGFIDRNII
jgi:hypothetical protein